MSREYADDGHEYPGEYEADDEPTPALRHLMAEEWDKLPEDDYPDVTDEPLCPNCVNPWKCNGPHLIEGAEVVLFNKPGTVRWVLPEGKGVAVVFEDGSMYWAYAEHIGEIGGRE